ncbi:MAG: redoxin domain-containing protein [Proteobacteria bacterium]|nr:redoxin domain-containing protein [Pseudomonadota bacterium]
MKFTVTKNTMFLPMLSALACIALVQMPAAASTAGQQAPDINSPVWINSAPQRMVDLHGKVVLVEFWTYGCSNCRNVEPYIKAWHEKYARQGLVVIGVHSPEFAHESAVANVKRYVTEHAIRHAVAIDNDFAIWNSYHNRFWPTLYLVDKRGVIRYTHIGEGAYNETERQIEMLLAEK